MSTTQRTEAKSTIETLEKMLKQKIEPIRRELNTLDTYVRYKPEITFTVDGLVGSCRWESEYVQHSSNLPISLKIIPEFKKTNEYQDSLKRLLEIFPGKRESIEQILSSYLIDVVGDKPKGNVDLLIDDLEGRPPSWHITAKLYGVVLEKQEMVLSEGIKLRRVNEDDLTSEIPIFNVHQGVNLFSIPHSMLEISCISSNPSFVQKKVEKTITLLSLFKETCAMWDSYSIKPKSYTQFGGTMSKNTPLSQEPKVIIKDSERNDLISFISYVEPKIPDAAVFGEPLDPLEVSIKRYLQSIREMVPIEEKLTRAVMGLESLFLENESELRYRLATRVSFLLGYLNEDPSIVYGKVSKAYHYRSSYVHGSVLTKDKRIEANQLLNDMWRYLRKAVLIFLSENILSKAKKKEFLKEIDAALINDVQRQTFKERIDGVKSLLKGAV